MDDEITRLRLLLADSIEMANVASAELRKEAVVASKRGGGRISPWLRVWDSAVKNACGLARVLNMKPAKTRSLEEELEALTRPDRGAEG